MKKRLIVTVLAGIMATALTLAGCGSASDMATESAVESPRSANYAMESKALYDSAEYSEEAMAEGAGETTQVQDSSRKLITRMNISAETENLDETMSGIEAKVKELGGYIESSDVYNGSTYYSGREMRYASLTVRVPSDKLNSFVESVAGATNITNKSTNVEDITLSYVDTESRKNALKAEESRLLEILEKAETIDDVIAVEQRLSEVRYQLESIESQLRTFDNKINYSTVELYIEEVVKYTPTKEETPVERMREGIVENFNDLIDGAVEFFIFLVIHIPQIIAFLILVAIIVVIVKLATNAGKKRKMKQMAQMQAAYMQAQNAQVQNVQKNNSAEGKDGK